MNEQPKQKFYKRPWVLLIAGMIVGPVLAFLALISYENRNQIGSLPFLSGARNAAISASKKSVRLTNCVGDPASIQLAVADYTEKDGNPYPTVKITFINLDSQSHSIEMAGVSGEITAPANGTIDFSFGGDKDGAFTCDGKKSFVIKAPSKSQFQEVQRSENNQVRSRAFSYLPGGVKDCANKVLGADNLQEMFSEVDIDEFKATPEKQVELSMCIYNTLSPDNKKCVADIAGGEQNLENTFKNVPASIACYGQSAACDKARQDSQTLIRCMGVERYSSLLMLTGSTQTIGSPSENK